MYPQNTPLANYSSLNTSSMSPTTYHRKKNPTTGKNPSIIPRNMSPNKNEPAVLNALTARITQSVIRQGTLAVRSETEIVFPRPRRSPCFRPPRRRCAGSGRSRRGDTDRVRRGGSGRYGGRRGWSRGRCWR